jgi:hypothetical protein
MNIEKAIEILENHQCDMPRNEVPDLVTAIKLGIEALKRIQASREHFSHVYPTPLPGETKE